MPFGVVKMNLLFLGYIGNPTTLSDYSGISIAGQNYQINFLDSLNNLNEFDNISVISIPPLSAYPVEKRIVVTSKSFLLNKKIKVHEIGFINIPIVKQINQVFNAFILTRKYLKNNPKTIIIQFNVFPQTGLPLFIISKLFNNQIVTILADLPINDNPNLSLFSSFLRKFFDYLTIEFIHYLNKKGLVKRQVAMDSVGDLPMHGEIEETLSYKETYHIH